MRNLLKSYWKPFLFVFTIYLIASITLMRDHVSVLDDLQRSVYGYGWSQDWNRYTSSLVGFIIHQSATLFDISPINQIIGLILLSISSILLTKLFTNKLRPLPLLFSTLIGLTPFMANAWQFHFDIPYISLSILAAVLPYSLYWQKIDLSFVKTPSKTTTKHLHLDPKLVTFLTSILLTLACLIVIWTSFQPANGIFLVIGLGLLTKNFIEKQKDHWPSIITFIACYIIAAIYAYISTRNLTGYRDISTFPLPELFSGILTNLNTTFQVLIGSLSATWAILIPLAAIGIITYACLTRRSFRPIISLPFFIVSIPFAISAYLALVIFPIPGRTFIAINFSLAIFCLLCASKSPAKSNTKLSLLLAPTLILIYSFCTFFWSYGNALADQDEYDNFRITLLMSDLAEIYPTKESRENILLQYFGTTGPSAVMIQELRAFPVTRYTYFSLQEGANSYSNMGYPRSLYYYASDFYTLKGKFNENANESHDKYKVKLYNCDVKGYKTLTKNYYHEIRALPIVDKNTDKNVTCVIFNPDAKNPQLDDLDKPFLIYHTVNN